MNQTKPAPCGLPLAGQDEEARLPIIAEPIPESPLKRGLGEPTSAIEAVRYLFLAKELRRLGQPDAADRWQSKAMTWLTHLSESGEADC